MMELALRLALEHDLPSPALRAYNNLGDNTGSRDRLEEALAYHEGGIALARRVGNRQWEWQLLVESTYPLVMMGRWDEAIRRRDEIPDPMQGTLALPANFFPTVYAARGQLDELQAFLSALPPADTGRDMQARAVLISIRPVLTVLKACTRSGSPKGKRRWPRETSSPPTTNASSSGSRRQSRARSRSATSTGSRAVRPLAGRRAGELPPFLKAQLSRFEARLLAARGEPDHVERGFKQAASIFREFGMPFWLAMTQLEHAEWLIDDGREEEAERLLDEARQTFDEIGAAPWLDRPSACARAGRGRVRVGRTPGPRPQRYVSGAAPLLDMGGASARSRALPARSTRDARTPEA